MEEEPKTAKPEAIIAAEQALAEAERIFGKEDLVVAERLEDLAGLHRQRHELLEAANLQARARAIRKLFGQVDDSISVAAHQPQQSSAQPVNEIASLISETFRYMMSDARQWCRGRSPWARLPVLIFFAYVLFGYLRDPQFNTIFMGLNLGIHEMGHAMFMPLGWMFPNEFTHFVIVAAGSAVQCAVPIGSMIMFLLQRDYFGIAFAFGWLSTNLFGVALYAGDAQARELPLVSPFGPVDTDNHDWYYLLSTTGLLQCDHFISVVIRLFAILAMLVCLIFGGWLLDVMRRSPGSDTTIPL